MSNTVLSVIVPVYNGRDYLRCLVKNILDKNKQIIENIELILVDDGSTDGSYELLAALSTKHPCIKVFQKDNGGIASARNFGLLHANGMYVTFMDQDDSLTQSYEPFLRAIANSQSDVLISDYSILDFNGKVNSQKMGVTEDSLFEGKNVAMKLLCGPLCNDVRLSDISIPPSVWNCIFKRETLNKHDCHFFSFVDYEDDWLFLIQILQVSKVVMLTPKEYYCWAVNKNSESHSIKYIPNLLSKKQALEAWIINSLSQLSVGKKDRDMVAWRFEAHSLVECFYNSSLNLPYKRYKKEILQAKDQLSPKLLSVKLPIVQNVFRSLLWHKCYFIAFVLNRYVLKRHFH